MPTDVRMHTVENNVPPSLCNKGVHITAKKVKITNKAFLHSYLEGGWVTPTTLQVWKVVDPTLHLQVGFGLSVIMTMMQFPV